MIHSSMSYDHLSSDAGSEVSAEWFKESSGKRVATNTVIYNVLQKQYPGMHISFISVFSVNLRAYAAANSDVVILPYGQKPEPSCSVRETMFLPPSKRLDGDTGGLQEVAIFERSLYRWQDHEFILYEVEGKDGLYQTTRTQFILGDKQGIDLLLVAAGQYQAVLHDEIWVFDQGFWQKSRTLYESILKAGWDNVILDANMKADLIDTVSRFFDSRAQYQRLKVPWKRGIIFYGPPGNGKTISIKATMHTLYRRDPAVPTLYVKSLSSFAGPEYSVSQIFAKARSDAPCYLVFEDLDSLVTDSVRSFFLNAVDGLSENEGILMIGSTNHLDRLDPGIARRPSRFDRKYLFPNPSFAERMQYCHFWQQKLADNKDVEFPDKLCDPIASLTEDFSFAYMQEAFVTSLLSIAGSKDDQPSKGIDSLRISEAWEVVDEEEVVGGNNNPNNDKGDDDDDWSELEKYILWRKIKVQIKNLRKEMSDEKRND